MWELDCVVQHYAWGRLGSKSAVALLTSRAKPIDEAKPYAELWMGTHPNGPSSHYGKPLAHLLNKDLPYLFKILSVGTALSIQAHPDRELAKVLFKNKPDLYKDDNHKPEMAVALTPFEAMCGFRSAQEIANFLQTVPEFRNVVGEANAAKFVETAKAGEESTVKRALRTIFTNVMKASKDVLKEQIDSLIKRLSASNVAGDEKEGELNVNKIVLRLSEQYPGDVGIFGPFFLNLYKLEPGQALFLGAGIPHAYLAGDCVEAMACSDNVVRAGLTPKYLDVDTLCDMLTYDTKKPKLYTGDKVDEFTSIYRPPVEEFLITKVELSINVAEYLLKPTPDPAIIIVISGSGLINGVAVHKGSVVAVEGGKEDIALSNSHPKEPFLVYRCSSNQ